MTDHTGTPLRLKTARFLEGVQSKLNPRGIVVFNLHNHTTADDEAKAIRDAFPQMYVFPVPDSGNTVVVTSLTQTREKPCVLSQRACKLDQDSSAGSSFQRIARYLTQ